MTLKIGNKIRLKQEVADKELGRYIKNTYIVSDVCNGKIQLESTNGQKNAPMFADESQIVRVEYNEDDNNPLSVQEVVIKKYITSNGKTFAQKANAEAYELSLYKNKLIDQILSEFELTETELLQIVNQAGIIDPRDEQTNQFANTTLLTDLDVEDIKRIPEFVKSAKSINELTDEPTDKNDKLTDEEIMQALEFAGVDNWEFYDEAISNFREEYEIPDNEALSPEDMLYALQIGGVDNWEFYDDAIESYVNEYKN